MEVAQCSIPGLTGVLADASEERRVAIADLGRGGARLTAALGPRRLASGQCHRIARNGGTVDGGDGGRGGRGVLGDGDGNHCERKKTRSGKKICRVVLSSLILLPPSN